MAIALVMSRQPERRPYIWRTLVSGGRASDPRERTEGQGGPWGGVAKGRGADMAKKGKLSRRSFLARVAGAAAMTGAASIVTGGAQAQNYTGRTDSDTRHMPTSTELTRGKNQCLI